MHLITYPDVVYKVATDAILIQSRCIQSVVSLENIKAPSKLFLLTPSKLKLVFKVPLQILLTHYKDPQFSVRLKTDTHPITSF